MGKRRWFWVLLLLVFCLQVLALSSQQQTTCSSVDLEALKGFMGGMDSGTLQGWYLNSSGSCCRWPGVTCGSSSRSLPRVIGLNLTSMELNGPVSNSLAGLDKLRTLDLSNNSLTGAVPAVLFQLPLLEVLDLSLNKLSGGLPADSRLPSIRSFNISSNSFNGTYPFLAGSANLTRFDVSSNRFKGIVNASICNSSPKLQTLHLSSNMISGAFPVGFGNCHALEVLRLDSNAFSGSPPEDLFGMSSLKEFYLRDNLLAGELSPRIGNLSNLISLDLSTNNFSGSIPDVFGKLGKLESFCASSNRLSGGLPPSLSNLAAVRVILLRNNSLDGEINLDFKAMTKLSSMDLGSNVFSGEIPAALSSCVELKTLNLARNRLHGGIPESFRNLSALSFLSLSNNSFSNISSALRILQHCPSLSSLVLTMNSFHGETMSANGIQGFKNLSLLVIANCGLVGPVPEWLGRCSKLQLVDLSWNRLGGSIPSWFGNLDSLFYLDLSNNSLSGDIPEELTGIKSLIRSKPQLGSSPADFPFFSKKNRSATGLQYNQLSSFPPSLILDHNKLGGPISPLFGNLKKLHELDLSHNNLTGTIPEELSGMSGLEVLDLSYNQLTGSIPSSLNNLSFLSTFNVAYNNLSGLIPTGAQFSTFANSCFVGNSGLCRENHSPCNATREVQSANSRRRNRGIVICMALGIGFGTAVILALLYLILSKAHSGRVENTENDEIDSDELREYSAPSLVALFQNKDGNDITIDDISKATNNFDQANIIGCGGFGLVYKATFADGKKVAIKRLSGNFGQLDKEFQAEIQTLSRAEHKNLVMLHGFCRIGSVRILIYAYMENGSLDFWLHEKQDGGSALDWGTRLRIAQGAARGLEYLHLFCQPHILHRDIKSSNILLDENFEAHLADFGLARLIRPYDTHVTTDLVGTLGYIPPEYGQASIATFKGDIYSLGIVLLELLTGRRPMDMCQPRGRRELVLWVLQMKHQDRETEVFDPFIYDKRNEKQVLQVLEIACHCISDNPKDRPLIQQIVSCLDNVGSTN